jgi:D-psicose/D-tagatose/L-ribulose 3-epimerase
MKIGCHGSVWTGVFDDAGLRHAIAGTAAAGFDLIEFPIFDPDNWNVELTKKLLDEYQLEATASLGLTAEINISSSDPDVVRAGEEHLGKVLHVLHQIGGKYLVGVIYGPMTKNNRPATEAEVRNGQAALVRLGEVAGGLGITLGLEVVNRYESNILNTARQAVEYAAAVGRDNVTVHLDTYHMNIEESGMFEPVLTAGDRLGYVHIGESHRGYLGTGTVDFDSFFRALAHQKFDGPVVFESFSSTVVSPEFTGTLAIWRNLWEDGADLGRHANDFIRGKLRAIETISLH